MAAANIGSGGAAYKARKIFRVVAGGLAQQRAGDDVSRDDKEDVNADEATGAPRWVL
jgi:hypothetical protein